MDIYMRIKNKGWKDFVEKEIVAFLAISCDLFLFPILSGCSLTEDDTADHKRCSIALITMFNIVGAAYITVAFIVGYFVINGENITKQHILFYVIQAIAGFLYYLGDNFDIILTEYGSTVGCTNTCMRRIQSTSFVFLFLAEMLYLLVERGAIFLEFENLEKKPIGGAWKVFKYQLLPIFLFVRYLPKIDAIYTTLTLTTRLSNDTCEELHDSYQAVAWVYFSLIPLVLLTIFFTILIYYWIKNNWKEVLPKCILGSCQGASAVAVTIIISAYLLADNRFPLDCVSDSEETLGTARLTLSMIVIAMIILVLLAVGLVSYYLRDKFKTDSQQTT